MTLGARKKSLLYSFFALIAILLTSSVFALVVRFSRQFTLTSTQSNIIHETLILAFFLLATSFLMIFSFRKTVGPEIYFFSIFIFSLSFECLKAVFLFLLLSGQPAYILIIFSKIIYSARVFSLFALFSASLFCTGLETRRILIILAIIFFVSIFFGLNMIVTGTKSTRYLLYFPGYRKELYFFFGIVFGFHIFNYIYATVRSGSTDFLILGLASLLAAAGSVMLYFSASFLLYLAGMIVLIAGIVIYSVKIHSVYLWI
ncbi:MAG: hypothetical protein JW874_06800 [Spirochaetales bacterium]|nr:hypothetical protein [Spirochaetales bacterium]